jgi:MFS family permease
MAHASKPWYREMTRYHWFVLVVAALGWMFDCLDQQLFILARQPAMKELMFDLTSRQDAITMLEAPEAQNSLDESLRGRVDPDALQTAIDEVAQNQHKSETEFRRAEWVSVVDKINPRYVKSVVDSAGGYATAIFLIGWASGGLFFGVLGDRIGRAKTMLVTILMYSAFTGLSALSRGFWDFALYRFLTGLGVGGEFAVGVALVAEVMPERARAYCLSLLQALSAIGNVSAALISMGMGTLAERGILPSFWRPMFVIGAIPALLAVVVRVWLKEPERWEKASHEGEVAKKLGSYRELFRHPNLRKNALLGLALAFSGVVGLWGVGFFTMDLIGNVLGDRFAAQGLPKDEVAGKVAYWKGITSIMINVGACMGMFGFGIVTQRIGRKPTFAMAFTAALLSTVAVFGLLREFHQVFWMVPIMGFCQLSLFAGYAIYFPELFPTHLRSTGTSFCYNVGRFVAALGPALLALLTSKVYAGTEEPLRYAGLTMTSVFLIGLIALPFLPETKDLPLPD